MKQLVDVRIWLEHGSKVISVEAVHHDKEYRERCHIVGSFLVKEAKMTREEALKKMVNWRNYGEDAMQGWFLDNCIALGLIKFDEPKKDMIATFKALSKDIQMCSTPEMLNEVLRSFKAHLKTWEGL